MALKINNSYSISLNCEAYFNKLQTFSMIKTKKKSRTHPTFLGANRSNTPLFGILMVP
ncbi:hypothetical protein RV02_GL002588 [Enterococcus gilvus]|nr:hypothetical protein RV02_GL002588 [Enterococcus gilvus]